MGLGGRGVAAGRLQGEPVQGQVVLGLDRHVLGEEGEPRQAVQEAAQEADAIGPCDFEEKRSRRLVGHDREAREVDGDGGAQGVPSVSESKIVDALRMGPFGLTIAMWARARDSESEPAQPVGKEPSICTR
jgi:hypothetical protein